MQSPRDPVVGERAEEKQRKKRSACVCGIIKRIYFLTHSYQELTFALGEIGGCERVISGVPFLPLVLDATRSASYSVGVKTQAEPASRYLKSS